MRAELIKYKDDVVRCIKYTLGSFKVCASGKSKKSREYLATVKGQYKGRCFIVCNGPSLTGNDLDKLKNEVTFASNRIYKIFDKTDWRPTYYMMQDESVAMNEGTREGASSIPCKMKFFRQEGYDTYKTINGSICWLHTWWSRKYLEDPQFSTDLQQGIYSIATVTYSLIQLAVYMGFTEIYIIGADNKYSVTRLKDGTIVKNDGVTSYFSKEDAKIANKAISIWELDTAYEYAEKFSRKNGFRIYNATRGGYLETFERKNLDDVLSERQ